MFLHCQSITWMFYILELSIYLEYLYHDYPIHLQNTGSAGQPGIIHWMHFFSSGVECFLWLITNWPVIQHVVSGIICPFFYMSCLWYYLHCLLGSLFLGFWALSLHDRNVHCDVIFVATTNCTVFSALSWIVCFSFWGCRHLQSWSSYWTTTACPTGTELQCEYHVLIL